MRNKKLLLLAAAIILAAAAYWMLAGDAPEASAPAAEQSETHEKEAGEKEHAEKGEHGEEGEHEEAKPVSVEKAANAGVKLEQAGAAKVGETITLSGRILLNQNKTAPVKARFSGMVREVKKSQGDQVAQGDVLATVESNDSLQVYPIKAPIGGTIITRTTNIGDVAGEAPLFTIADLSQVWAEFHVFPRDVSRVKVGQSVMITSADGAFEATAAIASLLPVTESATQTVVARVILDNPDGVWRSGMIVRGDAVTQERDAELAVKTSAIQRLEDKPVVFVEENGVLEPRPVKIGARNKQWTEILEGIEPGARYAAEGSFLLKAEHGKSEAEHED